MYVCMYVCMYNSDVGGCMCVRDGGGEWEACEC